MPVCSKCKIDKDVSEFFRDRRAKSGHRSDCKTCSRQTVNRYLQAHPTRPMTRAEMEQHLDQHFQYDPATQTLLCDGKPRQTGQAARSNERCVKLGLHDYAAGKTKSELLQNVLWWLFYRRWPKPGYRLVNRYNDPADLDVFNWREVPVTLTRRKRQKKMNASSRAMGVTYDRNSKVYKARLVLRGEVLHLGCYQTEREAADAYNKAARKHFREFATINDLDSLDGQAPAKPARVKSAKVKPAKAPPAGARRARNDHRKIPEATNHIIIQRLLAGDRQETIAADLHVSSGHVSRVFNNRLTPALQKRIKRTKALQRLWAKRAKRQQRLNKENG